VNGDTTNKQMLRHGDTDEVLGSDASDVDDETVDDAEHMRRVSIKTKKPWYTRLFFGTLWLCMMYALVAVYAALLGVAVQLGCWTDTAAFAIPAGAFVAKTVCVALTCLRCPHDRSASISWGVDVAMSVCVVLALVSLAANATAQPGCAPPSWPPPFVGVASTAGSVAVIVLLRFVAGAGKAAVQLCTDAARGRAERARAARAARIEAMANARDDRLRLSVRRKQGGGDDGVVASSGV